MGITALQTPRSEKEGKVVLLIEQVCVHSPEGTHAGEVCLKMQPIGKTPTEEIHRELSSMGGTPCWIRGRV